MRIVLHAGLHKSGTTSVQTDWHAAFSTPGPVWYPALGRRSGGHQTAVWPLLDAFTNRVPADLVWAAHHHRTTPLLPALIAEAVGNDVEVLLISTEELDRLLPSDVPRFAEILAGHDVTVLITATRPMHRWASGWQMLVKHGLAEYPREAEPHVLSLASMEPGRLEELATLLPAARRVVRLVRTTPHEPSLARDLAESMGVRWPERVQASTARNVSLGTNVEILRRMNRADLTLGTRQGPGRRMLRRLTVNQPDRKHDEALAAAYAPPPTFLAAAHAERRFLEDAATAHVEVLDPHDLLATWTDMEPPAWYDEISRQEAVLPALDDPTPVPELLWRVRQQRSALQLRLDRSKAKAKELRQEREALREQVATLERTLRDLQLTRSWAITRPLRSASRFSQRLTR